MIYNEMIYNEIIYIHTEIKSINSLESASLVLITRNQTLLLRFDRVVDRLIHYEKTALDGFRIDIDTR